MVRALLVLFAVCVLPAIVVAHRHLDKDVLSVEGKVYCDTCQCGYENEATKYLAGAVVQIQCRSRKASTLSKLTFTKYGVTDSTGSYKIPVRGDRGDDYCDVVLVKSSDPQCNKPSSGRDRARVVLCGNNGMVSNTRFANPMGFVAEKPLASCTQVLKKYEETEEE